MSSATVFLRRGPWARPRSAGQSGCATSRSRRTDVRSPSSTGDTSDTSTGFEACCGRGSAPTPRRGGASPVQGREVLAPREGEPDTGQLRRRRDRPALSDVEPDPEALHRGAQGFIRGPEEAIAKAKLPG